MLDEEASNCSDEPVSPLDEADAIVACCWRYGSYAHLLCNGESYRDFHDSTLSRLSDQEMMRINIEFSAGLAEWWSRRAEDSGLVNRRVRAAIALLDMPWRNRRSSRLLSAVLDTAPEVVARLSAASRFLMEAAAATPSWSPGEELRLEANMVVLERYRNEEIEALHAGISNEGTRVPGYRRLYKSDIRTVAGRAAERIGSYLAQRALGEEFERVRPLLLLTAPYHWTLAEDTSDVEYVGSEHGSIETRLQALDGAGIQLVQGARSQ